MWSRLKRQIRQWQEILMIAPIVAGLVVVTSFTGIFQLLELSTLDQFFRWRSPETPDPRIVIVTIDDADIVQLQQWPISDRILANLIQILKSYQPRVIGLNIYRDFPIEPGHQDLIGVWQTTPNLIGIKKVVGNAIAPPPILQASDQVGFVDLVLDEDGKVRRDLLAVYLQKDIPSLSLGAKLAFIYLKAEGITPEEIGNAKDQFVLGKTFLTPLAENAGGYVHIDNNGYQILFNFRGTQKSFQTISITRVLAKQIPPDLLRDRVILIGVTAESISKSFLTPYSSNPFYSSELTPGVIIQANSVSQLLSAALDGRPLLRVFPDLIEWLWVLAWSFIGATTCNGLLQLDLSRPRILQKWLIVSLLGGLVGFSLIGGSYIAFLLGWWLPVIAPLAAMVSSAIAVTVYKWKRLAIVDNLTQIPNRRYFDEAIKREWEVSQAGKRDISIILGDIDYFKEYNDTYGHQAGDECLQKVAQTISQSIRRTDLVARYGGEEFIVILPNTPLEQAIAVAERMVNQVKLLQIPHVRSRTSHYVTLSCGIASTVAHPNAFSTELIHRADTALYQAKIEGRDRAVAYLVSRA